MSIFELEHAKLNNDEAIKIELNLHRIHIPSTNRMGELVKVSAVSFSDHTTQCY